MLLQTQIRNFFHQHQIELLPWKEHSALLFEPLAGILIWVFDQYQIENAELLPELRVKAENANLRLIVIPEKFWIQRQELVQSRLLSLWKKNKRILAKNCLIDRVDNDTCSLFLEKNHFFGTCASKHRLGLYNRNGELQAVATFGKPRFMTYESNPYYSHEWLRYASLSDTTVVGGMGRLLQAFILETKAQHIMTYADLNWGTGKSFEKLGFKIHSLKTNLGSQLGASMKYILDLRANANEI